MKSICEKHQQAYETGAGCPYCEPDEARADGFWDNFIANRQLRMEKAREADRRTLAKYAFTEEQDAIDVLAFGPGCPQCGITHARFCAGPKA